MIVNFDLDPLIKCREADKLYDVPVIIRVNSFTEESAKLFAAEIQKAESNKQPIIPIVIDSYGGQVYSLLSMVDILKRSKKTIATIVSGKAMSCGAILFTCGTEGYRFMGELATLMIHDVSLGAFGKVEEVKNSAEQGDKLNKLVYRLMAENTGHKKDFFIKMAKEKGTDWFLDAEECKKLNLTNHIRIPEFEVKISVDVKFK